MQKSILLSLLFAWSTFVGLAVSTTNSIDHPFHASVTELMYNSSTGNWEMSLKVFTNDFENTLNRNYQTGVLNLGTDKESNKASDWIQQYIQKHIKIMYNNAPLEMDIIGREGDLDALYIYVEFKANSQKGTYTFYNTVLFELFDNQENIVHTVVKDKKASFYLTEKKRSCELQYL